MKNREILWEHLCAFTETELLCRTDPDYAASLPVIPEGGGYESFIFRQIRFLPATYISFDYFDMIYVLDGHAECLIGPDDQTLSAGDLCLLPPGCPHGVSAGADDLVLRVLISRRQMETVFSATPQGSDAVTDFLRNAVFLKECQEHLLFHTAGDADIQEQILEMYQEEFQPDGYSRQILPHMLMVFFIRLKRKYKLTAQCSFHAGAEGETSRILRYIQEGYVSATLAGLADLLGYSVPYCSRIVRESTGLGFSALLKRARLVRATDYLLNTELTVHQIGMRIGYENPENFMRMFKKEYGISPSQFRLQARSGE